MGEMVEGIWRRDADVAPTVDGGFRRAPTRFRNHVAPGGPHPPAAGRYHLYVSLACPWAHRALIARRLKGLEAAIGLSVTHWLMGEEGWTFAPGPGVVPDPFGAQLMSEVYRRADPRYTGRVTVPVLWDIAAGTIVNNESADILRILNSGFDALGAEPLDLYPEALRPEIDAVNARVYETVNNGVYRAGFAKTQAAYEAAVVPLFDTLDWLDRRLTGQPYLCGETVTEADWRLFTTLVRFDAVYHGHFKCNLRRLVDYDALWRYARRLHAWPGVAETVDMAHIKAHYYGSHRQLNPTGIVPLGPAPTGLEGAPVRAGRSRA